MPTLTTSRVLGAIPAPYAGNLAHSLAYMAGRHAARSGNAAGNPYPAWTVQAAAWDAGYASLRGDRP